MAIAKDAKDWTLDEQVAVAKDIADDTVLERLAIGQLHRELGAGMAGLTFEATNSALGSQRMNATDTNAGGWDKSELRTRLNSGDLWLLLPSELQSKVKPVTKTTDNVGGNGGGAPSATTDKVFLLSATEVYGDMQSDGIQYECYKSKGVTRSNYSGASGYSHWTRSVRPRSSTSFRYVQSGGICYSSSLDLWTSERLQQNATRMDSIRGCRKGNGEEVRQAL